MLDIIVVKTGGGPFRDETAAWTSGRSCSRRTGISTLA